MRFGVFLAPFHQPGQNPTLSLERDLELIVRLDQLGYDEVWVGEHHSTGWETITSPELFLAVAAERTRHIRLGTGVVSLPYHHPLMVADRITLLDHLTRGRVNFGVGPGGHVTDALMLGIDPSDLRPRMAEALEVILRLMTESEPITRTGEWYELHDAVLQLRPVQRPHPPVFVTSMESPAGMAQAGRHGVGVISLSVSKGKGGPVDLASQWRIAEEEAERHGTQVDRSGWRIAIPMYLAETRELAFAEAREGAAAFLLDYTEGVTGRPAPVPGPRERVIEQMAERGSWIVGTPDDAIAAIERLVEETGGFGGIAVWGHEWAGREAIMRSHELFIREVAPRFTGALDGILASRDIAVGRRDESYERRTAAVAKAREDHVSAGG
jgi:limonene 1,2-monooxygenase